ncbi:MAG: ankyrin repeat domain-containing protein [Synergistaceae bacterium]|nr:ankyrin repeat domain-containing protein [Synergistaceae bacterium]MBQ7169778.1 ankyrin repeat domain-containing protein [Synergistaceae bacterium]
MSSTGKNFWELCRNGHAWEILEAIRNGADVNAEDENGIRPLGLAVMFNKEAGAVKVLLENGAKMKIEERSYTQLMSFVMKNPPSYEVIKLLMDYGMLIDTRAYDGTTALILASNENYSPIIESLIRAGADVNASRSDGITALMMAARKNAPTVMRILLKHGAAVRAKDTNGMTALHHAAMNSQNPELVNMLIAAGAEDSKNASGKTALMLAAMINAPEVLDALMMAGFDVTERDNDGKSALDYARDNDKLKGSEAMRKLEEYSSGREAVR